MVVVAMVYDTAAVKVAVIALSLSIKRVAGFCVPLKSPAQPVKVQPEDATAVAVTVSPKLYDACAGVRLMVPLPTAVVLTVSAAAVFSGVTVTLPKVASTWCATRITEPVTGRLPAWVRRCSVHVRGSVCTPASQTFALYCRSPEGAVATRCLKK